MTTTFFTIIGIAYIPLVVLILFRVGRQRRLNDENTD